MCHVVQSYPPPALEFWGKGSKAGRGDVTLSQVWLEAYSSLDGAGERWKGWAEWDSKGMGGEGGLAQDGGGGICN